MLSISLLNSILLNYVDSARLYFGIKWQFKFAASQKTLNHLKTVCALWCNRFLQLSSLERNKLLTVCESTLQTLEVRANREEANLKFVLRELQSLTVDQGIHLTSIGILCTCS